ncbi:MAG TPA: response regulator, partial [Thermoanaerobaculia bacterium]|nr:response regulator [Thermoanaerobaculia bacterium]
MNAATRKKLFAYAIPVDLVVVATGVGLLVPGIMPLAVIGVYVAAVGFSAWKSGWIGALAAMVLSAVALFVLFSRSVQQEQIGWFAAASIIVAVPLAAWGARVRRMSRWHVETQADVPPYVPMIATPRSIEETAAAAIIDERDVAGREAHARAEGERVAAGRFAIEKKRIEDEFTRAREQMEREQTARFEQRRTELQATYERERVTLKAKFDAARQEIEAERAELRKQLEEERRRPAAETHVETHLDEEAIAQRLEHLRAELQQQFDRELRTRVQTELAAQRQMLERDSQREIEKVRHSSDEQIAAMRAELDAALAQQAAMAAEAQQQVQLPRPAPASPPLQRGIFSNFFRRGPSPQLKLNRGTVSGESTATRRAAAVALAESSATRRAKSAPAAERKARILFLELRRASADTAAPRLRQLGIEIVIVERLVDAVDEIYRFRPDIIFIDTGVHDFDKAYKTISGLAKNLPIVLTSRNASSIPDVGRADIAVRPYDIDEVVELARAAVNDPQTLLAKQSRTRADAPPPVITPAVITPAPKPEAAPAAREGYDIVCANCRVGFDAVEADWCSCLTRERTVVCTNCLTCFCKAAPAYKETFWMNAPPRLFERRTAEQQRLSVAIAANPSLDDVTRPLVMLVEDDEEIQAVMQRVCANLRYGSISAANGQEGLELARSYRPDLIFADSFLPRLDGREMCRLLKQDPAFANTKMVVMTGLYADTQYKGEAIKRFGIDDYLARPVSITDLINLLQRHLEGTLFLPAQENLYELHRKEFDAGSMPDRKTYEVACITCGDMFDAAKASWCTHADGTLLCEHCGNCFCKASAYRRRFWADAPAVLFERKMIVAMRNTESADNPSPSAVTRPLIALLENDEAVQLLVKTIVTTLGYGFIASGNIEEARALVREYGPDMILADAWTPNLDGREVCRQLKEAQATAQLKT